MLQTLKNAWKTKDIKSKIIFTLFILVLYRIGTVIPVPFVEANNFAYSFSGTILDQMNILSGNALGTATLFALGVSPYINASIIIQLLGVVFPKLGELAKNDKDKMNFITRIVTVVLAIVTAIGYYFMLKNAGSLSHAALPDHNGMAWFYGIAIVACYVAGASVIMWLAERINERGIGNGISMILFANIVSSLPSLVINLGKLVVRTYGYSSTAKDYIEEGLEYNKAAWGYGVVATLFAIIMLAILVALTIFVIYITGSERRVPVQYAKRVVGRKMYGGQSSNIPLKLNMTGVMPIIFASSIVSLIPTILTLCGVSSSTEGGWGVFYRIIGSEGVVYPVCLFLFIIGFAYFYTQITFDPMEVANNLKKQGGAIPGIRQGKPTADYIRKILNKVTIVGALFLGVIAVLPVISGPHLINPLVQWMIDGDPNSVWAAANIANYSDFTSYYYAYIIQQNNANFISSITSSFTFGGTSLLIVVGVAIETYRELEAQLTMRNYKGFL